MSYDRNNRGFSLVCSGWKLTVFVCELLLHESFQEQLPDLPATTNRFTCGSDSVATLGDLGPPQQFQESGVSGSRAVQAAFLRFLKSHS